MTDIIGCFAVLSWAIPVHEGENPSNILGMVMQIWDETGMQYRVMSNFRLHLQKKVYLWTLVWVIRIYIESRF